LLLATIAIAGCLLPHAGARRTGASVFRVFALVTWWTGDPRGALVLAAKSFLSVLAALTLAASTPWARLLDALASLHVPRRSFSSSNSLDVIYLSSRIRRANAVRGAIPARLSSPPRRQSRFHAAAGAVGVLFARSWERADGVYQAMLARGFTGRYPTPAAVHFHARDAAFLGLSAAATVAVRLAL